MLDVLADCRIRIIFSAEGAAEEIRTPSTPAWKAIWRGCIRRGGERIIQCERILLKKRYATVILEEENMKRLALIGLMLTSGATVFPQDLTLPQLQQKLIELEQRVRVLEKALLAQGRTPADANNTQVPAGKAAWRRLRRGMSGRMGSRESMEKAKERLAAAAAGRGIPPAAAAEIWRQIESFAGYAFCKAHSASFALLSWQVAFLKAHWPAEFIAAVLSNGGGFYPAQAYLDEARRLGLAVLPPDRKSVV